MKRRRLQPLLLFQIQLSNVIKYSFVISNYLSFSNRPIDDGYLVCRSHPVTAQRPPGPPKWNGAIIQVNDSCFYPDDVAAV